MSNFATFTFVYLVKLVVCLATIGYAVGIPWAIFYVVAELVMTMISFSVPLVLVFAGIGYGILFHYGLPWWYALLFGQNVLRAWNHASASTKVRNGELDEIEAIRERTADNFMAEVCFWIGMAGMIYQIFFA